MRDRLIRVDAVVSVTLTVVLVLLMPRYRVVVARAIRGFRPNRYCGAERRLSGRVRTPTRNHT